MISNQSIKNQLIKNTNLNNLGVDYPTHSELIKTKIKDISLNKLMNKFPFIKCVNGDILTCGCDICDSDYTISRVLLNERNREGYGLCTNCNQIGVNQISQLEKDILTFIKTLVNGVKENDRSVLGNKELDIYIPSHNIAFEFDGLYWHSELYKDKNYHLDKTKLCEEKGIKLIHIFEDEWVYKKDIVKSRIKNLLGLNEIKIFARKCVIKEVSVKDNRIFLDENHIQGECKSKIKLGLYYDNELVSLMTFGKGRVIMGGDNSNWELTRFCNKLNTNVVGGASKLLKYFIRNYNPNEIISYADRRWSQGGLYDNLGFEFIHDSVPNYWYINGDIREYRFKYRKNNLTTLLNYSDELSEHEIMLLNKRYRIYDCGNKKYSLKIDN
jgi:very-short-patch-repair endonuclease